MGRTYIFLRLSFLALIVLAGFLILLEILGMVSYQQHLDDGLQSSYDSYSSILDLVTYVYPFLLIPLLTGFVFLIIWTRKAYKISETVSIMQSQRRYSRGWTVGAWFIPFGNLFVPKKVITEIERILAVGAESEERVGDWQKKPINSNGTWWWILWIVTNLMDRYLSSNAFETVGNGLLTTSDYFLSTWLSVISNAVTIVSLILGIGYLGYITRNANIVLDKQNLSGANLTGVTMPDGAIHE